MCQYPLSLRSFASLSVFEIATCKLKGTSRISKNVDAANDWAVRPKPTEVSLHSDGLLLAIPQAVCWRFLHGFFVVLIE